MPLHSGQGTRALRVHGPPCNATRLVHPHDVISERLRIVKGVGVRLRLGERDARHQVDELLDDADDAEAVRLALVVGNDRGARLQRQGAYLCPAVATAANPAVPSAPGAAGV